MRFAINGRFLSTPKMTGVERVGFEITKRLIERNDLECLLFCGEGAPIRSNDLSKFHIEDIGRSSAQRHAWEQCILPLRLRQKKIDVLLNPSITGPVFAKTKQIVMLHDVSFLPSFGWHKRVFSYYYSVIVPTLVRQGVTVVTGSEFSKREIVNRLGAQSNQVHVVPYGVSSSFAPTASDSLRQKYNLPNRYLLFVGSIEPRKNLRTLLQSMNLVQQRSELDDVVLVLAGGLGKNFSDPEINKLSDQLGNRVRFLGYTDERELPALYSGALALVFPSLYEGFGLPALEAMACGTQVIASDTTSLPEVVDNSSFLVDPLSPMAIASAIERVASSGKTEEASMRCRARASEFTWEATVDRLVEIVSRI